MTWSQTGEQEAELGGGRIGKLEGEPDRGTGGGTGGGADRETGGGAGQGKLMWYSKWGLDNRRQCA